jgi:hypothetical protein
MRRRPDVVTARADDAVEQAAARGASTAATRQGQERAAASALDGVDRAAATIPGQDLVVPRDARERAARRQSANAPSAEELKVLQALNTPIDPAFKDTQLQDAADTLSTLIGLPVVVDKAALADAGIDYSTPVTFALKTRTTARTVLRAMLAQLGLTYVVKDGLVYVTTPLRARDYMVTKVYPVGDLVIGVWGTPFFDELANAALLLDVITGTIDPLSWDLRGGPGSVRYYPPLRALVIRQSAEVHPIIHGSLYKK